jgi:hypothetical protein
MVITGNGNRLDTLTAARVAVRLYADGRTFTETLLLDPDDRTGGVWVTYRADIGDHGDTYQVVLTEAPMPTGKAHELAGLVLAGKVA